MCRFVLAFVLLIFSFNAANASGLLNCCDMGRDVKTEAKASSAPPSASMPKCHMMMSKTEKKEAPKKANHCLCAAMCANKISSVLDIPEFKAVSFDIPVMHGEHDMAVSVDRQPESPPPKI